jgi:nucleoside-diphosphate-sugar epimerase
MALPKTTIPKGSWILVTGASGFIASHVGLRFLELGFKVRGSVRDISKSKWLEEELFAVYADKGDFKIVQVPDMAAENAFDDAVKGVSAVVHVATINTWDSDPNKVIPQTVAGVTNAIKASAKEPSVKRFVFTSSVATSAIPMPNKVFHVNEDTWNDMVGPMAWAPPPYGPERAMITYGASKVEAERAVWKFVKDNKPGFVVNTVNPFTTLGEILNKNQHGSTAAWVLQLYRGETAQLLNLPACKFHLSVIPTGKSNS